VKVSSVSATDSVDFTVMFKHVHCCQLHIVIKKVCMEIAVVKLSYVYTAVIRRTSGRSMGAFKKIMLS
jgi:hypothetical protein